MNSRTLVLLAFLAAPLSAQTSLAGKPFEVRLPNDTSWHLAREVSVGDCPAFALEAEVQPDGFLAHRYARASAIRVTEAGGAKRQLSEAELAALPKCGGGSAPAAPSLCGGDPETARAAILGLQDGLTRSGPTGSPVDVLLEIPEQSITIVTDPPTCAELSSRELGLLVHTDPAPPVIGVIRIGDSGEVVVRQQLEPGPGGHGVQTMAYFDGGHTLRTRTVTHF